jgi:lipopolysaccharide export system permease protein
MKIPLTLSRYIARHFLISMLLTLLVLVGIVSLIDLFELLRRAGKYQDVPFAIVLQLLVLKTPVMLERLMPYAVLIGSIVALTRLTRTHELIVARAAGVSVWQFLFPAIVVVLLLGTFVTTVFNPLSSALLLRYEQVEAKYLSGHGSLLVISSSGLWMRQMEDNPKSNISEHIINAARVSPHDMTFSNLVIFSFGKKKEFIERLDAQRAILHPGTLDLASVVRSQPGKPPENIASLALPTSLTMEYIQDSFASPESMSFWRLPSFINMLEEAGFSAMRHRLYYQSLLANPLLMAGMVWVAAVFSLRLPRRGKVGLLVACGMFTGFTLYFFTDLVHALGAAGTLPIILAAWAPALVMMMIGAALLLHIEDG